MEDKLRVGLTYSPGSSLFDNSDTQTPIHLAEFFKLINTDVVLVNVNSEGPEWWGDCKSLENNWTKARACDLSNSEIDVLIDCVGTLTGAQRKYIAKLSFLFYNASSYLHDVEKVIYNQTGPGKNYDNIISIITWDYYSDEELEYLKTTTKLPVAKVPFVWYPTIIDTFRREIGFPFMDTIWSRPNEKESIIMESGNINSSGLLPIIIAKGLMDAGVFNSVCVTNSDKLIGSPFFKANVYDILDLSGMHWQGKTKTIAALMNSNCIITNTRFNDRRLLYLDAMWLGIPMIHNSKWLREFKGYDKLYYNDFEITEAINIGKTWKDNNYEWFSKEDAGELRNHLIKEFSTIKENYVNIWYSAFSKGIERFTGVTETEGKKVYNIVFTDFWISFNCGYNFFILLLENALKETDYEIRGYSDEEASMLNITPDLVIFSVYGKNINKYINKGIPLVCYSAERTPIIDGVDLNLTFEEDSHNNMRLPNWQISINWFGADSDILSNPKLVELGDCLEFKKGTGNHDKFGCFVVSNPCNEVRNNMFLELSKYKHIDSWGHLYNNMGPELLKAHGGAGGELDKLDKYTNYKYILCFENQSWSGYTTEKLFHAKVSGAIPIYWGNPNVAVDFSGGFIDCTGLGTVEEMVNKVREFEESGIARETFIRPALTSESVNAIIGRFGIIAKKILRLMKIHDISDGCVTYTGKALEPRLYNYTSDMISDLKIEPEKVNNATFILNINYTNLTNLHIWDALFNTVKKSMPAVESYAFFDNAIKDSTIKSWIERESSKDYTNKTQYLRGNYIELLRNKKDTGGIIYIINSKLLYTKPCEKIIKLAIKYGACIVKDNVSIINDLILLDPRHVNYMNIIDALEIGDLEDVCKKHKIPLIDYREIISTTSLDNAIASSNYGFYKYNEKMQYRTEFIEGISNIFVINLKRREDRLMRFANSHSIMSAAINIFPAVDGRKIIYTDKLTRLFINNNFHWKKGAMGCNLSHLHLWNMLANSSQDNSYLIFEDDASPCIKDSNKWLNALKEAIKNAPKDYEILYIGGILPPNKSAYDMLKVPINKWWNKIKPNSLFGKENANHIHMCTFSYIISKNAAKKLIEYINNNSYNLVVDHFLLNNLNNKYYLNEFISKSYQEEDEAYNNSQFNNLTRTDNFDSDLWNNNDMHDPNIIGSIEDIMKSPNNILDALKDSEKDYNDDIQIEKELNTQLVYELGENRFYELEWLSCLIPGVHGNGRITPEDGKYLDGHFILYQQKHHSEFIKLLSYIPEGKQINIIHTSDEWYEDDIVIYKSSKINKVIRTYGRQDCVGLEQEGKIITIPLGYYRYKKGDYSRIEWSDRKYRWSFHGSRWRGRDKIINTLEESSGGAGTAQTLMYNICLRNHFNEPLNEEEDYLSVIYNSQYIPCPAGQNVESYRLWEALEAGAIPIIVRDRIIHNNAPTMEEINNTGFYQMLQYYLPSLPLFDNWQHAIEYILMNKGDGFAEKINEEWVAMKETIKMRILNAGLTRV